MTAEVVAPADELTIAACPNCGTLYRVSEERKWCPACSTDAGETIDLRGMLDLLYAVADNLGLLLDALASGIRVERAELLAVLPKALETLVVPAQARPPVARPSRRGPNSAPVAAATDATAADPEQDQGGAGVDAAAAESTNRGEKDTTGFPPTAAAAEPETGT